MRGPEMEPMTRTGAGFKPLYKRLSRSGPAPGERRHTLQTFHVRAAKWLPFAFAATLMLGSVLEAQTLGVPAPISGDCTTASGGAVLCSKTNGAALQSGATTAVGSAAGNLLARDSNGLAPQSALQPLVMDPTGLLGMYYFDETTGNLLDHSGNGNTATVVSAPYRAGGNYEFYLQPQTIDFPAALNATNTYYFVVTLRTTPGGADRYGVTNLSTLFTNSGSTGLTVFLENATNGPLAPTSGLPTSQTLAYSSGTLSYARNVLTGNIFTGTHVIALSCPSTGTGTFYLDGVAVPTTSGTQACYNANTTGNLRLGSGTSNAGTFPQGTIFWGAAFYSTSDNFQVVARRSNQLRNFAMAKGAPFAGTPQAIQRVNDLTGQLSPGGYVASTLGPLLIGAGDSILCGYGLSTGKCTTGNAGTESSAFLGQTVPLLNNTYQPVNFGVPSAYLQDSIAAAPVLVDPLAQSFVGQNLAVLQTGTNNFNTATTYPFVWGLQASWAAGRAVAGARPVLMGIPSRTGANCNGGQNCDAVVQAMNALQRQSWKSSKFLAYVDLGSDPLLGATGAFQNQIAAGTNCAASSTQMFFQDGLHLCGGHTEIAKALACVLNGLDGTNSANMGGATLTANSTLACADGGRYADPTSGAVNLSLWSAMWQTGREIGYCNVSSSTSNALTLTAPGDFPFSNVSGRTTVTVAPNSCVRFRATFNGNVAAPGNYWMQL